MAEPREFTVFAPPGASSVSIRIIEGTSLEVDESVVLHKFPLKGIKLT